MSFDHGASRLKQEHDYLAPDTSEIRLLSVGSAGSLCHCTLPAGKISTAVRHRNVEEIWYCVEGDGELWRGGLQPHETVSLTPGTSVVIPSRTAFQFRSVSPTALKLIIVTMPPWPGSEEAEPATGHWR
jgi:mannose-6-phosphate isomerase-like protein (cupin superfamily)